MSERQVLVDVAGVKAHCLAALVQQSTPWATEALAELVRRAELSPAAPRHEIFTQSQAALAQAQADQQARLRVLVGTWRGRAMVDRSYGRTVNASTYEKCADELEAVLGGKE